jgi:hypothetical protein
MPVKKGQILNPNGRGKGVQNKTTVQAKEAFATIMYLLEKRMVEDTDVIGRLTPARAAELYVNLLNYIKPKLSSNTNQNENTGEITVTVKYEE